MLTPSGGLGIHRLCLFIRPFPLQVCHCFSSPAIAEPPPNMSTKKSPYIPPKSALFIQGAAAQFVTYVVDPRLNFDKYLSNPDQVQADLLARGLQMDVPELFQSWKSLQQLRMERDKLTTRREAWSRAMKGKEATAEEKFELSKLITELKTLNAKIPTGEVDKILSMLKIPAFIHPRTPRNGISEIIFQKNSPIGKDASDKSLWHDVVEYSPACLSGYFLRGAAAELELQLQAHMQDELEELGFDFFSGPHLFKAVVFEGCATPFENAQDAFMIQDKDALGSAFKSTFLTNDALNVFAGYFANSELSKNSLPHCLQSSGRIYKPRSHSAEEPSPLLLFDPIQTHSIGFCVADGSGSNTEESAEKIMNSLIRIYSELEVPFRVSIVPADQLELHESLRFVFQVFSPSQQRYFSCGHVSVSDDYFSTRLRCHIGKAEKNEFVKFVHGSAMLLTPFVAASLEHFPSQTEWFQHMQTIFK